MDVFHLRDRVIKDYSEYIGSFIKIRDARIDGKVNDELEEGLLWPQPLIQLNPSFAAGETIDELADLGVLHDECRRIFRIRKDQIPEGAPMTLHRHQSDAVKVAAGRCNYVLTTGTGSGKSLAYIIPIVDRVLRTGPGRGIQAIIVYPMNALANSQHGELEKFLRLGYPDNRGPVSFERYTGQESDADRARIMSSPPDILLTNYMMLELMLTRPDEGELVRAARGLEFLVLDELHTYRGRQGADVALLVRRVRDRLAAERMQCVGTSATLLGDGTREKQAEDVASVAQRLFGAEVQPEHVIGETLQRTTAETDLADPDLVRALRDRLADPHRRPPDSFDAFCKDPLACWIESTFGVETDPISGTLRRSAPKSIAGEDGAAVELSRVTGLPEDTCARGIQETLLRGYDVLNPRTRLPVFAFRLHQFISRGDAVYASLEHEDHRYITLHGQQYVPNEGRKRVLLPVAFCRDCGQEYYVVRKMRDKGAQQDRFIPRELMDSLDDEDSEAGFLYVSASHPWPADRRKQMERLPDGWCEEGRDGLRVKSGNRKRVPTAVKINPLGVQDPNGLECWYAPAPFRFCLRCGVAYDARQRSDLPKLGNLGSGGRSTATTILSLAAILGLRDEDLDAEARKLLSFTDNRQDASLQAGHFNDFIETGLLRGALCRALSEAGEEGIGHDEIAQKVFEALNLPIEEYASDPEVEFGAKEQTKAALRDILGYRLYHDLRRGWRINAPNLEQCGLLDIRYLWLDELCGMDSFWEGRHPAIASASKETRLRIAKTFLDHMRQQLAIKVSYLDSDRQASIEQRSYQRLIPPWSIDEGEKMVSAPLLYPRSKTRDSYGGDVYVWTKGRFGQYLRRPGMFPAFDGPITSYDSGAIIRDLLDTLRGGGLVERVKEPKSADDVPGYQLQAACMRWHAGDGTAARRDPLSIIAEPEHDARPNPFFVAFYKDVVAKALGIRAKEHTAQVPGEERVRREEAFREGRLPILYCSPTMELGVDIAQLNVVNMRNVPPTPANYAQRSGRAGRSGQPALVFSYCTAGSSHDQFFFRQPDRMVRGAVTPPRIELANKDLLESHVHAIWLAETGLSLGKTLGDVLDLSQSDGEPSMRLKDSVRADVESPRARADARARAERVLRDLRPELRASDWYTDSWLDDVFKQVASRFDAACDRWRGLHKSALDQFERQSAIVADASRGPKDKDNAKRLRGEAETQMALLTQSRDLYQSDFYSYRYFASEGFLPGYNFPRLPLSAFIPGRRGKDEFLSRPRFLAISEFGPRAFIYHEGSRYIINKVILPVNESEQIVTRRVKICSSCGYLHVLTDESGPDLCQRTGCGAPLGPSVRNLFRLENVSTKRRDRINCDEEERLRLGYELRTGVRFAEYDHTLSCRKAVVESDSEALITLAYGDRANLWRVNLGWARRKDKDRTGFGLDIERGYWERNDAVEADDDDPMSRRIERVIPYVEDHRNCLLLEPSKTHDQRVFASLQAALKQAVQACYHLEDNEIAAEPLPDPDNRRLILFYEASEGGAGVLRRLVDDPAAMGAVAREALQICHYDPDTGEDRKRSDKAREDCEAACYDCLMTYANQRDHALLDRKVIRDLLLKLVHAKVASAPSNLTRREHLEALRNASQSTLEQAWLDFLEQGNLRLPSKAQLLVAECGTRPDFCYEDLQTAIYVDGPHHDYPDRRRRDQERTEAMEDQGWTVIRFGHKDDWGSIVAQYAHVFGKASE